MKLFPKPNTASTNEPPADPPDAAGKATADPPPAKRRRVLPIHPFLFALFPILALYAQNIGQVTIDQLGMPLGRTLLTTLAVWVVFLALTRKLRKSAIAATVVVWYGLLQNLAPAHLRGLLTPVIIIGLAALLIAVLRTRKPLFDTTSVMNLTAIVLVAPSLWAIGNSLLKPRHEDIHTASGSRSGGVVSAASSRRRIGPPASKELPDVYYIILDAYGRDDRLRMFYGYDNSPFLKALEDRGFYIARHSGANYDQTQLCLASALSMNYLEDKPSSLSPEILRQRIDDNEVANYLSTKGYHYVNIWSGMEESRVATADLVLNNQDDVTTFEGQALGLTLHGASKQAQHGRYEAHRERIRGVFRNLNTVAQLPYPKFVFAHALSPHPPFVFGPNGEGVDPIGPLIMTDGSSLLEEITRDEYKKGYINQLQYINQQVLGAVDSILKQSRRPPIIIIQGDHGSRMNLDWYSEAKTDLREPFSNLNAYLVPKKVRGYLYDDITPVNSFRILLSHLFGAKLEPLPNRSFYSTASHPFDFKEVTRLLRGESSAAYTGPGSAGAGPAETSATK